MFLPRTRRSSRPSSSTTVAGKVMSGTAVKLTEAATPNGTLGLKHDAKAKKLDVGAGTVVAADVEAKNGVIHVVDTVLFPQQDRPVHGVQHRFVGGRSRSAIHRSKRPMQNLLPKIATGDLGAVEDFLKRHTECVGARASLLPQRRGRRGRDTEIFVDVRRSAARYDANVGSEVTFLMTIARRRLIDRARRLATDLRRPGGP